MDEKNFRRPGHIRSGVPADFPDLRTIAEHIVKAPSVRGSLVPAGYAVAPGERVLLVVNNFYDPAVVSAIREAISRAQAIVDVVVIDMGADRPLGELDEFLGFIYNWRDIPEKNDVRKWFERVTWADKLADDENYDLLIYGLAVPPNQTKYRSEGIPWTSREVFPAATFPYELWDLIGRKAWDQIWNKGKGGKVHISDPEGTEVSYTLSEDYYDVARYGKTKSHPFFQPNPFLGHLFARQTPPLYRHCEDASGVIAGTTNHCSSPFPNIRVEIAGGKVVSIQGGGTYGQSWRDLMEETRDIQYPEYPDKGLFWWWETGIGTNPKMRRPSKAFMLSGCGTTYERLRSGVVHIGIGTAIQGPSEVWAKEKGLPYGHLHVHLLNCIYEITCTDGQTIRVVENGHLVALDDPEVRVAASKYGDPDELLREVWWAPIPGITVPGDYMRDYAPNPAAWLRANGVG